jgi:hypothetical protein
VCFDAFAPVVDVDAHVAATVLVVIVVVLMLMLLVIYGGAFTDRGVPSKARNFSDSTSNGFLFASPALPTL